MKLFLLVAILACATTIRGKLCAFRRKVQGTTQANNDNWYPVIPITMRVLGQTDKELYQVNSNYIAVGSGWWDVFDDTADMVTSVVIEKNTGGNNIESPTITIGGASCSSGKWTSKIGDSTKEVLKLTCNNIRESAGNEDAVCDYVRIVSAGSTNYRNSYTIRGYDKNDQELFTEITTIHMTGGGSIVPSTVTRRNQAQATKLVIEKFAGQLNIVSIEYPGVICKPGVEVWSQLSPSRQQTLTLACTQQTVPREFYKSWK